MFTTKLEMTPPAYSSLHVYSEQAWLRDGTGHKAVGAVTARWEAGRPHPPLRPAHHQTQAPSTGLSHPSPSRPHLPFPHTFCFFSSTPGLPCFPPTLSILPSFQAALIVVRLFSICNLASTPLSTSLAPSRLGFTLLVTVSLIYNSTSIHCKYWQVVQVALCPTTDGIPFTVFGRSPVRTSHLLSFVAYYRVAPVAIWRLFASPHTPVCNLSLVGVASSLIGSSDHFLTIRFCTHRSTLQSSQLSSPRCSAPRSPRRCRRRRRRRRRQGRRRRRRQR